MSRYQINDRIENRYLIYRVLQGGLGEVYLCSDLESECYPIALKTFQSDRFDKAKTRRLHLSLHKEAAVWTALGEHPNIVRCFYTDLVDNQIFLFLELIENNFVDGASLDNLLNSKGRLAPKEALTLILDVCRGLAHAASVQSGIVHRDLKPGNILIDEDGVAKITDFGLAKVFNDHNLFADADANPKGTAKFQSFLSTADNGKNSLVAGTPLYMSPEQWRGLPQDHRSDIYAVGCIFYELLTGTTAFDGEIAELQGLHLSGSIPKLPETDDFDVELNCIIERCLAKEANGRFQSIGELTEILTTAYRNRFGVNPREPAVKYLTNEKDHSNTGHTMSRAGLHEDALKFHNLAIEKNSTDPRFFVNRGITLEGLGEAKSALADYNKAVQLDPYYARAYYHRGNVLCKVGMYEEAKGAYLRTILIEPDFVLAYANLGQVFFRTGNADYALAAYKNALEIDPTLVPAYSQRGYVLTQINRPADAENDFLRARELDPMDALCHLQLGFFYNSQKKHLQAIDCFKEAVELGSTGAKAFVEKARNDYLNSD